MARISSAVSLLRRFQRGPLGATRTSTGTRPYTSFTGALSDTVAAKVTQVIEGVWLADEKLVTEPRRRIEPQHALTQSLAERLATQRNVRQRLVPTNIKVDKSRQYVEFTWPPEAAGIMRALAEKAQAQTPPCPPVEVASSAADSPTTPISSKAGVKPAKSTSTSSLSPSPLSTCACVSSEPECSMPLRTRALAEYLRAFTPSTDGALGAKDIVIYGRRGISISHIIPIGNYALRFVFSDNHAGGIYSYEYLFYLTGPATKYGLMRAYIRDLKKRRKSRDPPKRAPSKRYANGVQAVDNTRGHEMHKS